jgi:GntR family phosphonate transport system transcriptional regulator/GntR family transcriptional regulator
MPPSWTETVRAAGHDARSEVTAIGEDTADEATAALLEVPHGATVLVLERRSTVDGRTAGVGRSHLPADLFPGLADRLDAAGSLFRTLTALGFEPVRASVRAELAVVPAVVAPELGLEGRPPTWRIESRNRCARTGRVLERSVGWMRADVLRVVFELEERGGERPARRAGGTR